jgi:hypothetical protein
MITELIERLQAANAGYCTVVHAWTLDVVDQVADQVPMAIFVPGPVDSELSPARPVRQRQTISIAVLTICDWRGRYDLLQRLYGALLGYQHSPQHTELQHVKGEVRQIRGELVEWMDMFSADHWIDPASLPYTCDQPEIPESETTP